MRSIIHIDMDAFYASVEQRDNPEWRGKPLVVGSSSKRGVVAAASYEARKFGVYSALSSQKAIQYCPQLIFAPMRMDVYKQVSKQIRNIFYRYTDLVEPLSLDEAFLDVTENEKSASEIAMEIKEAIKNEANLNASAGVSYNKFLAKLASDMNKPAGFKVINQEDVEVTLAEMSVNKFFGVGPVTAKKMHTHNIHFGKDLKKAPLDMLVRLFGKQGQFFYEISRGIDEREVNPNREQKSLGVERTFTNDLQTKSENIIEIYHVCEELMDRLNSKQFYGRTISLKMRFNNFETISKSKTIDSKINSFDVLLKTSKELLSEVWQDEYRVRLLGISISNIVDIEEIDNSPVQLKIKF